MRSFLLIVAALLTWSVQVADGWGAEAAPVDKPTQVADKPSLAPAPDEDLQGVQGMWVRTERVGLLGKRRITKEIKEDRETVTYYDAIGGVENQHTVKVELRRAGPIRVFTFSEQEFTAGPNRGATAVGGAYVYKIVGDTFIEMWGVLENEDREIEIMRWQRQKP